MKTLIQKILAWFRYVPYEERAKREAKRLQDAYDNTYVRTYAFLFDQNFADHAIASVQTELDVRSEYAHMDPLENEAVRGIEDAIVAARRVQERRAMSAAPPSVSTSVAVAPRTPDEYYSQYGSLMARQYKAEQPEPEPESPAPTTGRRMRIRPRKKP